MFPRVHVLVRLRVRETDSKWDKVKIIPLGRKWFAFFFKKMCEWLPSGWTVIKYWLYSHSFFVSTSQSPPVALPSPSFHSPAGFHYGSTHFFSLSYPPQSPPPFIRCSSIILWTLHHWRGDDRIKTRAALIPHEMRFLAPPSCSPQPTGEDNFLLKEYSSRCFENKSYRLKLLRWDILVS